MFLRWNIWDLLRISVCLDINCPLLFVFAINKNSNCFHCQDGRFYEKDPKKRTGLVSAAAGFHAWG